jgi:hypothetical protein
MLITLEFRKGSSQFLSLHKPKLHLIYSRENCHNQKCEAMVMFNRIRNTIRIISYREKTLPPHLTPEVVFIDHEEEKPSKFSITISATIGVVISIWLIAMAVPFVTQALKERFSQTSLVTVAGGLGALLFWTLEHFFQRSRDFLAKHFQIALAPHLGHKIEKTFRILRGHNSNP